MWYIVRSSRCLSSSLWKGGRVTRSLWPQAAWGHPAIPADKGKEQAAWGASGPSVPPASIYSALFPGPCLRIRPWGCRSIAGGPRTCNLLSSRETSKQGKHSAVWGPMETRQGRPGWGSLLTPVTWATGRAWASGSFELPDLTSDHCGMSLFVLHNDSWPDIYFIWCGWCHTCRSYLTFA